MQPDPWGFEETPVETWADILGAQAWDLVRLSAFLVFALVSFQRKSVPPEIRHAGGRRGLTWASPRASSFR